MPCLKIFKTIKLGLKRTWSNSYYNFFRWPHRINNKLNPKTLIISFIHILSIFSIDKIVIGTTVQKKKYSDGKVSSRVWA